MPFDGRIVLSADEQGKSGRHMRAAARFLFIYNTYCKHPMTNTSRIAKNTLMLYFRQILIMLVSLYTVRVVLAELGAEDYGIYNVVAGAVVLFTFVNNAMASATQRFLSFSLGKGDLEQTCEAFTAGFAIHLAIALLFVLAAETAGLWFVETKLNIPEARKSAASAVYQFTIAATVFNIIRVPYHALIIAHERMGFFAAVSVVEAALKIAVAFLLAASPVDKLSFYAFLLAAVAFVILLCHAAFCMRSFDAARLKKPRDKKLAREMISFSGWSLFGATANMANSQGTNIVLNLFTNVTVNAAMGIANQVNAAVYSFVSNFQTAFNPQIVKSWAARDREAFFNLLYRAAKFSFYLLLLISLPFYLNAEFILSLWLKEVPAYSVGFVRLILIWSLIESLNGPLYIGIQATGKIRAYQIIMGLINFLNLPLTAIALAFGGSPFWLFYIKIALNAGALLFRVFFCKMNVGLSAKIFAREDFFKPVLIAFVSFCITSALTKNIWNEVAYFFASSALSVVLTGVLILAIGFTREESRAIFERLSRFWQRRNT